MTAALLLALALAADDPAGQDPAPPAKAPPASAPSTTVSGVTATAAARPDAETSIDRKTYSLAKDLNATTGSMADVLRNIPSVQIDAQGNLSLRGDSNVTILIDGRPSSQFSNGNPGAALQSMPADRVESVQVMTNPPPEFRADGSGGIINIITKTAKGAGTTGSVRVAAVDKDVYSLTLHGGYNSNKLSLTSDFHFLRNRGASDQNQIFDSTPSPGRTVTSTDPMLVSIQPNQYDGGFGADYDLTSHDRLSASLRWQYVAGHTVERDDFDQIDSANTDNLSYLRVGDQRRMFANGDLSLTWKHTYGPGHDLTFNGNFIDGETHSDRTDNYSAIQSSLFPGTPDFFQKNDQRNFNRQPEFKVDYQQALPGKAVLKAGYQFDYTVARQDLSGDGDTSPIFGAPSATDDFTDNQTYNQAYFSYQRPFDKLTILAGARAEIVHLDLDQITQDVHSTQNYARLYPNIRFAYDLGGGSQWTASYTRRIVRPVIQQLDPFHVTPGSAATTIVGNPDLKPEDISSYELAYEHRTGANSFQATLYYRSTSNYFSVIADNLGNGLLEGTDVNAGHLLSGGGELVYSRQITPRINYNFSVDGYWTEINAPNLGVTQVQTLWTGFGRANLAWQITPKDYIQLNAFINGQGLAVQGRTQASASGNIGYRRIIDPKTTFTFTLQDPFRSLTYRSVYKTSNGTVRMDAHNNNRYFIFALVRTFGGASKPTPPPGFDFAPGGTAGGAGF